MDEVERDGGRWPARAGLLLVLGALCGLGVHLLTEGAEPWRWTEDSMRLGAAAAVAGGGIVFAFSLERRAWPWSIAFALIVALTLGGVTWGNGRWSGWGANEGWQFFSALLAVTIAVPLFQTARDAGRPRFDYQALHAHSWTNVVLWCAAWAFVLIAFLLAELLAQLFGLIGIHFLVDLLRKSWFGWMLVGGTFGGAIGLLRDRDQVLGLLQRVATAILSVLTPVLALGLVIFVCALPFTGLAPLWSETRQATPILLFCILDAFVLINATIGNAPDEEARAPVLRYAALSLGVVMLPLGIVAAVSTGKRIGQYGLTPDRLWAITFVAIALACGLAYFAAILRRRRDWGLDVRRANIGLSIGICGLALFLALPILNFGAISAGNQLWRIRTGQVASEKADWAALRFDFGPSGRRAVERLAATSPDPRTRMLAARILKVEDRYAANQLTAQARDVLLPRVINVRPRPAPVPREISDLLFRETSPVSNGLCVDTGRCLLLWHPGDAIAIAMLDPCDKDPRHPKEARPTDFCQFDFSVLEQTTQGWREVDGPPTGIALSRGDPEEKKQIMAMRAAVLAGKVELRTIQVRQLFVDGKPQGPVLR